MAKVLKENIWNTNETDTIFIKDEQEILESMDNGHGTDGYKYTVKTVSRFKGINTNRKFHILDIIRSDGKERIIVIDSDIASDLISVCDFDPSIPRNKNRKELIDNKFFHIFEQPADENNFIPSDLEYSSEIFTSDECKWNIMFGCFLEGSSDLFVQLYCYGVNMDSEKNEVGYIIEMGGVDRNTGDKNPDGGLVLMYKGRDVEIREIEIFQD